MSHYKSIPNIEFYPVVQYSENEGDFVDVFINEESPDSSIRSFDNRHLGWEGGLRL